MSLQVQTHCTTYNNNNNYAWCCLWTASYTNTLRQRYTVHTHAHIHTRARAHIHVLLPTVCSTDASYSWRFFNNSNNTKLPENNIHNVVTYDEHVLYLNLTFSSGTVLLARALQLNHTHAGRCFISTENHCDDGADDGLYLHLLDCWRMCIFNP